MEDLVADGLIALHMEANNVDEYLQTARESTKTRQSLLPHQMEPIGEGQNDKNSSDPRPPPLPPRWTMITLHACSCTVFNSYINTLYCIDWQLCGSEVHRSFRQPC